MKINESKYNQWLHQNDEETRPVNKEIYIKYFNEGAEAFNKCLDPNLEDNPYGSKWPENPNYDLFYKAYPWYDGYRTASKEYFTNKYDLNTMQDDIRDVASKHGLTIEYSDEYSDPYAKTPEGFIVKLA